MAGEGTVERRRDLLDWSQWWPEVFGRRFWERPPWMSMRELLQEEMRIEELVEGDELVIRAEIPGIDPDQDVAIHVRNHTLEIRAERRQETREEAEGRYRTEFRYGSFVRVVPLPPDADESSVHASYRDGILEVRMPMSGKAAEATKIPVERA